MKRDESETQHSSLVCCCACSCLCLLPRRTTQRDIVGKTPFRVRPSAHRQQQKHPPRGGSAAADQRQRPWASSAWELQKSRCASPWPRSSSAPTRWQVRMRQNGSTGLAGRTLWSATREYWAVLCCAAVASLACRQRLRRLPYCCATPLSGYECLAQWSRLLLAVGCPCVLASQPSVWPLPYLSLRHSDAIRFHVLIKLLYVWHLTSPCGNDNDNGRLRKGHGKDGGGA